jgi:hypothetical protein
MVVDFKIVKQANEKESTVQEKPSPSTVQLFLTKFLKPCIGEYIYIFK